jgi:hypothetical protein
MVVFAVWVQEKQTTPVTSKAKMLFNNIFCMD